MEGEAVAGLAFGGDVAVMEVHGFADEKEFEADFLAVAAAEVKGIEDAVERIFIEAGAVVFDGEAEV